MNSRHLLLLATLTLGVAACIFIVIQSTPSPEVKTWYYDLNDRVVFSSAPGQLAPLPAPSGDLENAPPGTLAGVNVEVEIVAEGLPIPLLLRTYTTEARQALNLLATSDPERNTSDKQRLAAIIAEGSLAKLPDDTDWVVEASPAGKDLFQTFARRKLGGSFPVMPPETK